MKPRWRKVLADLWENKARTLLVIASITVGVFALGMNGASFAIINESMDTTYISSHPANIEMAIDPFDDDFIKGIESVPGVAAAQGRRTIVVRARALGSNGEWRNLNLTVVNDFEQQDVKQLTTLRGKSIPNDKEIILLEDAIPEMDADLGSVLEILVEDNDIRRIPVVGIVKDYTAGIELGTNPKFGYISYDTLDALHEQGYYNTLAVTVTGDIDDLANVEAVAERVTDQVEDSGRTIYDSNIRRASIHPYKNYTDAIINILAVIGVMVLALSSSLIINTMNALMAQQMRQIGVMKLIGARRRQVIGMYIVLVLFFGLISLVIAIPAGAFAAYQICTYVMEIMNSKMVIEGPVPLIPSVISLQAFVSLLVPVLAAFVPIIKGSRVTVEQALSGDLISQSGKQTIFDQMLDKMRAIKGILMLSLRNTFRQPQRLFLTIFTLALGGSVFIAVFNVEVSLDEQIDRILNYSSADIYLNFERDYNIEKVERLATAVPGVTHVEHWLTVTAQMEADGQSEVVSLMAPPDNTELVDPVVQYGRWVQLEEYNTVVVNDSFWNMYPDLQPGDQIKMEIDGYEDTWTVSGIFHYSGFDAKVAYTNMATLQEHLHQTTRASDYRIVTEQHTLDYQLAISKEIDTLFRDQGYAVSSVSAVEDRMKNMTEKLDILIYVLLVLAGLTGLVGSIGLSGMLSLNVLERTSEIGILRAVGAYDQIVARLVLFEGVVVGLVSYLLGGALSFPITRVLADLINKAIFGAPAEFSFTPRGFLIWLLMVLVLSVVASSIPARNATRLTIREVLAYE